MSSGAAGKAAGPPGASSQAAAAAPKTGAAAPKAGGSCPRPKEAARRGQAAEASGAAASSSPVREAADAEQEADARTEADEGENDGGLSERDGDELGEGAEDGHQKSAFHRFTRYLPRCQKAALSQKKKRKEIIDDIDAADRPRVWELMLSLRSMKYVGSEDTIDTFFAFSVVQIEHTRAKSKLRLLPEYSTAVILAKNQEKTLDTPCVLWPSKNFKLSYKDLDNFQLKVAMWRVSKYTFNTYIGRGDRKLKQLVSLDPNQYFSVKQKLTREQEEKKRKGRKSSSVSDVAMLGLTIYCEEVFDFLLDFNNWTLELSEKHPSYESRKEEKQCLSFVVPKNRFQDATRPYNPNNKVYHQAVKWKKPPREKLNWATLDRPAPFKFTGTRTALQNQCIIVRVHSANIMIDAVQGINMPGSKVIGTALMNLTSVLDISVFTGKVKDLQTQEDRFVVGTLTGSIKADMCSKGVTDTHEQIKGGRPQQPRSSTSVGHLKSKEMHLVVNVKKCHGLAVADDDTGSSDPYVRCTWDNMMQRSPVLKETLRPVFNFSFFFPVRLFNRKLKNRKYVDNALKYELKNKGDIVLQVWDDDDTSSDSLGFFKLPLSKLLKSKPLMRTLLGKAPQAKDDEEVETKPKKKQWFDDERLTRVYDGSETELAGCSLPNPETPLIYFEAWFYPDFDEAVTLEEDSEEDGDADASKIQEDWDRKNERFRKDYAEAFPDAIGARPAFKDKLALSAKSENLRRFTVLAKHPQTNKDLPLMALLCKIITPEEWTKPATLLHWINCITFATPTRQKREGEIPMDAWKDPQTFLFSRKGSVQDHALLLASVLLGAKKEAYVCKGTIQEKEGSSAEGQAKKRIVEHVWVMTRERHNWVTFWEPCTREMYHLNNRWRAPKGDKSKKKLGLDEKAVDEASDEDRDEENEDEKDAPELGASDLPDVRLAEDDLYELPAVGRRPKGKAKSQRGKEKGRDQSQNAAEQERKKKRFSPKSELYAAEDARVDWLPYDSIECVFDTDKIYANRQNHHPACIMYNFEEEGEDAEWERFDPQQPVIPVCREVVVDPRMTNEWIERREREMVSEMEENMRAARGKRGLDTFFDKLPRLREQLTEFLLLLEKMRTLDIDFCPPLATVRIDAREAGKDYRDKDFNPVWTRQEKFMLMLRCGSDKPVNMMEQLYNRHGSAFDQEDNDRYKDYKKTQERAWEDLMNKLDKFNGESPEAKDFEVRKGMEFDGRPVHFCTSDKEDIRRELLRQKTWDDMTSKSKDGTSFIIHCKMFPLLGGVQSTWLYIGWMEPPQSMEDQQPSAPPVRTD